MNLSEQNEGGFETSYMEKISGHEFISIRVHLSFGDTHQLFGSGETNK